MSSGCARRRLRCAAVLLWALGCAAGPQPPQRIFLIVVDTLRRDHVSAYGDERELTPHIDALARRGQRLDGALASFHQTTMSMGAIFTGRTPSLETPDPARSLPWHGRHWCGLARFAGRNPELGCIPASLSTLGERLHEAGFWTAAVVGNPLLFAPAGFERGFDVWKEVYSSSAGRRRLGPLGHVVNQRVREVLAERPDDRFFLYVHYMDAHDYTARGRTYAEGVRKADRSIGQLVTLLDAEGLLDDALLVLTSDHGHRLGEKHLLRGWPGHRGNPSFEETLGVPLIVVPALFDSPPEGLRGQDLYRLLLARAGLRVLEETPLAADELFLSERRWQTYRRGRFKSYRRRAGDALLLVDLERDPEELRDASSDFPDVARAHRERLRELGESTATQAQADDRLSQEDARRLRDLGYLEDRPDPSQ